MKRSLPLLALAAALAAPGAARAQSVTCEQPLFITQSTAPNVLILLDNSGSMNYLNPPPDGFDEDTDYAGPWTDSNTEITSNGDVTKYCSNLGANVTRHLEIGGYRENQLDWYYCWATSAEQATWHHTSRWDIATTAVKNLVTNTEGVNFGLINFNSSDGGYINSPVGSSASTISSDIDAIFPNTWTPLAETAEDALDYFKGNNSSYSSPISAQCQQNFFVIVTDGFPTKDRDVSTYLKNYYDGDVGTYPDDGSDYLDDVVKYMYDNDMTSSYTGTQNVVTYTVGFNVDAGILQQSANVGHGSYINANDSDTLVQALEDIVADVINRGSAGGSVAVLTTSEGEADRLFRAKFSPQDWSGRLEAYGLPLDGSAPVWDAGELLEARSASSRTIYTAFDRSDADTLKDDLVEWVSGNYNLTDSASASIKTRTGLSNSNTQSLINYMRGEAVSGKRDRLGWKLADIVYSSPVVVGPPSRPYSDTTNRTFRYDNRARAKYVYVAANDGGLHGFRVSDGLEHWKFIPENVISKLTTFWSTSYCHRWYVDGTPKAADVKVDVTGDAIPEWRTFLVGGQRQGGGAYFGLDVTDPATLSPRWQFTNANLGETWSEPRFARVNVGGVDKWVAFVGSGPNNSDTKGYLFAINVEDGTALWSMKVSDDTSNQLTSPQVMDKNADDYADAVYVGDAKGKLWRFDVSAASTASWTKSMLFQADANQAITGSPALTVDTTNKVRVYFGTGKYLVTGDKTTTFTQSFYGVTDPGTGATVLKSNFANQTTTDNVMTGKDGWYFNLPSSGDRVTTEPDLLGGYVFFTSFVPDSNTCGVGGTAKLFAVDYLDGTAPNAPVLDVDGDSDVDASDKVSGVVPKYVTLGDGVPSKPVIDTKNQQVIVQTSDTTIHTTEFDAGANRVNLIAWREVYE